MAIQKKSLAGKKAVKKPVAAKVKGKSVRKSQTVSLKRLGDGSVHF